MTQAPQITARSWLMIILLGLTWGGTFPVIEVALEGITPFWLAASRIAFGTLLTTAVWGALGFRLFAAPPTASQWMVLLIVGALSSAMPFLLISWGQVYVTAGFTGIAMACVALMVLPLAHFLVPGERITWLKISGFLLGFTGIVVLFGPQALVSGGADGLMGQLAVLGAAGCYAVSSVLMRRLPPVDPIGLATVLLIVGAVIVIPAAWVHEGPPVMPDRTTLIALAFLGLIPTAAANLLRVVVIRTAGPVFMSLTNYQVPLWSVALGAIFLGELLHLSLLVALVLILIGVALSQWESLKKLFARQTTGAPAKHSPNT